MLTGTTVAVTDQSPTHALETVSMSKRKAKQQEKSEEETIKVNKQ